MGDRAYLFGLKGSGGVPLTRTDILLALIHSII